MPESAYVYVLGIYYRAWIVGEECLGAYNHILPRALRARVDETFANAQDEAAAESVISRFRTF